MAFYENTIVAKQDTAEIELKTIKDKYNKIINSSSGKVIKIEEWGLLNLTNKIKNFKKGFFIHYKSFKRLIISSLLRDKMISYRPGPNLEPTNIILKG